MGTGGDMNFISQLNRFIEPLRIKIRMIVSRTIVSLIDDSKNMQLVQLNLMKDEIKDKVERVQNYGFTSHPKPNAQGVVLFVAGNRDQGLVIAVDDSRYRIKNLPEGGVAVYDHDGNFVKLTEDAGIEINAQNKKVVVHAAEDIELGSNLKRLINESFKDVFDGHVHNYIDSTGPSAVPTPKSTSAPASIAPTSAPSPGQGGISPPAMFGAVISDAEMTSKVKAE